MAAIEPAEINVALTITLDTVIGSHYRRGHRTFRDGDYEETYDEPPYTFLDAIVDRTATQLVDKIMADTTGYKSMRTIVSERLSAGVDERIKPMIEDAFTKPIPLTNQYGEHSGKSMTMTELVVENVRKYLNGRGNSSYDKSPLTTVMQAVTAKALTDDLTKEIQAAKAEIRSTVRKVTAEALTAAISKEIGA